MRASRAALLLGGWLASALSCSDAAPPQESAPAAPPNPRFWLVDTELADAPGQQPTRTIRGPALVELLPGGKVRSAPGAKEEFEGFLPEAVTRTPADRKGLMLYAQSMADMHLDSPAGPVLGRAHPGAFVSVAPHDEATWLVAVPRYGQKDQPLFAYVDKGAFGPRPRQQVPLMLPGKVVRDWAFTLWDAGLSRVLVNRLLCGDFHVTEDRGRMRATQHHAGIEVTGFLEESWPWSWGDRGESSCLGRMVFRKGEELREARGRDWLDSATIQSIPDGYLPIDLPEKDPLSTLLQRRASVFWLVQTKRGLECHEWKASETGTRKSENGFQLTGNLRRLRDPILAYFRFDYTPSADTVTPGGLSLWGPYFKDGGYRCVRGFYLLGAGADALHVDNPRLRTSGPAEGWTLAAYHPDDVEHWFLTKNACEGAKARAADALSKDPRADEHLGLHFDCFNELAR